MENITLNDFSAGWVPSDDPVQGRKNGLIHMYNLELDQNGVVRMSGGTSRILSAFSNNLHTIYQKYISSTSYVYSADTSGLVFRNNTQIESGGSTTRASFNAAFGYVFGFSGAKRFKDTGASATDLGIIKPSAAPGLSATGTGVLNSTYDYAQVNVLVSGSYVAKSARSVLASISPALQQVQVTPQNPSVPSSTANETWIFRRGGNLDTWYRIARVTTPFSAFNDNMSDDDALALGITLNDFLLSVNSTDTPDDIISCIGPIYGRLIYFTAKQVIYSDIYSPDSYDSRTVSNIGDPAGAEVFKWAIKVSKSTFLVGTNKDIYIGNGTFIQLPDGFLDVTVLPLGIDNPPIGIDVALYGNSVVYMSKIGWVLATIAGETISICAPNTDRLYNGETVDTIMPATIDASGATRYPICLTNKKIYCVVPISGSSRFEVLDITRKYWHSGYTGITPIMLFAGEDGFIYGFDSVDKFIKKYFVTSSKLLDDGSATKQLLAFRTMFQDDGHPFNPKDIYTLTVKGNTFSSSLGLTPKISIDGSTSQITLSPIFKGNGYTEMSWDISGGITDPGRVIKNINLELAGQVPDFILYEANISYDGRPVPTLHLNLQDIGLDSVNYKKVSGLNFIINTHGHDVDFYPVIDGIVQTKSTFNTVKKQVYTHYFTDDVVGKDFTGYFVATSVIPFEFYKVLPATILQVFPPEKQFDQVGPIDLFRYGKLKMIDFRVFAFGGTELPYEIFMDEISIMSGVMSISPLTDTTFEKGIPKTVAGTVLKVTLGPTLYTFARFSIRAQVARSGSTTEEQWIMLGDTSGG
jgi:hypothetical protein